MTTDTSPMIPSKRHKKLVRIQEVNTPPSTLFDTTVEYLSDELPEWFAPLQPIVEDETFTKMIINLGEKVRYHITAIRADNKDEQDIEPDQAQPGDLIEYRDWPSGIGRRPFARWHTTADGRRILLGVSEKTGLEISVQSHRLIRIVRPGGAINV